MAPHHYAVVDTYIAQVSFAFGAEFKAGIGGPQNAIGYDQILSGEAPAKGQTGLGTDCIVPGIDITVGDTHVARVVRIDPISITIYYPKILKIDVFAADQADVVTWSAAQS